MAKACSLSAVLHPHVGYTAHSGICAKTTMGVLLFKPLRSCLIQSSCGCPNLPIPSSCTTLTSPTKCTPLWSKLYLPFRAGQDLFQCVELGRLRRMGKVAGVNQKVCNAGIAVDLVQRSPERRCHIRVGRLVKPDMAVADLYEA